MTLVKIQGISALFQNPDKCLSNAGRATMGNRSWRTIIGEGGLTGGRVMVGGGSSGGGMLGARALTTWCP